MTTKPKSVRAFLASLPALAAGRVYLVIGPGTWGKSDNLLAAFDNACKPKRLLVYDASPDVYVSDDGCFCYDAATVRPYDEIGRYIAKGA